MNYYYANAEDVDGGIRPVGQIPPMTNALKYDPDASPARFVLQLQNDDPDPAWTERTAAEVEADYPGLIGVA